MAQQLSSNWEVQSNNGTNVVAYNRKTGRTLSTTLVKFNELISAAVAPEKSTEIIVKTAVPVVLGSSGTIDADGIVTLDVVLPAVYSSAWLYLPADAVVGGLAGYYYTVFATTTVGQVFTKFTKAEAQFIPYTPAGAEATSLLTAVGSAEAYSAVITAVNMMAYSIPGGVLGVHSGISLDATFSTINNVDAKTTVLKLGSTTMKTAANDSAAHAKHSMSAQNRGLLSRQVITDNSGTIAPTYSSVDTNADVTVSITGLTGGVANFLVMEALELTITV
jgi:hypothetical protein